MSKARPCFCSKQLRQLAAKMSNERGNSYSLRRGNRARAYLNKGCDFAAQGNLSAAEQEFLCAAKLGNIEAQVNLGNLYSSEELGSANFERAIYYYKRAILKGSPEAALNLAITYRGLGKKRLYLFWMRRAADLGDLDAKELLSDVK